MRLLASLFALLLLTGCAGSMAQKPIPNLLDWSGLVQPQDQVPAECRHAPRAEPKMDDTKKLSAKDAAREARKVRLWGRDTRRQLRRCQAWAKGQR